MYEITWEPDGRLPGARRPFRLGLLRAVGIQGKSRGESCSSQRMERGPSDRERRVGGDLEASFPEEGTAIHHLLRPNTQGFQQVRAAGRPSARSDGRVTPHLPGVLPRPHPRLEPAAGSTRPPSERGAGGELPGGKRAVPALPPKSAPGPGTAAPTPHPAPPPAPQPSSLSSGRPGFLPAPAPHVQSRDGPVTCDQDT